VVTKVVEKEPTPSEAGPVRAADILAQRLPSVPDKPATADSNPPNDGAKAAPAAPQPKSPDKNALPALRSRMLLRRRMAPHPVRKPGTVASPKAGRLRHGASEE